MTAKRWSLDQLFMCVGGLLLLAVFLPAGAFIINSIWAHEERNLEKEGQRIVSVMAREIVDPMLRNDRLAVYTVLWNATRVSDDLLYLCVEDAQGQVVSHTFPGGFPSALGELWKKSNGRTIRFRTSKCPVLDISVPILTPELGTLHAGLSRSQVIREKHRITWFLALTFVVAMGALVVGTRFVAAKVSAPLQQLERQMSLLPNKSSFKGIREVLGTREVESLARGFSEMANRLDMLEHERAATAARMINTERLAVLGELAAGLAHEIHNPLGGMLQTIRYLEADPGKSERAAKYYPMFEEGLARIQMVMKEMLTFARVGQKISIDTCAVTDIVESLRLLVQSHVEGRNVRVTWRNREGCTCLCDPQGLAQAALNLVLNAVDAAEGAAKPEVLVEATCGAQWVSISVEDSGPGVPEELREHIFDAFYTTKPPGKGTGLGLSVSRQLMRAVGGDVELSAEAASLGGARFVMRIPRDTCQDGADGQEAC
ncbi:MAG: HAMP domain-containing histidine kinase [Planctomycetes bacterium]|nr:HAMP domain-containing histidine kinase [Planctomycetota bacterium]